AERHATLDDKFAQLPRIDVIYKIPPGDTKDFYAVDVLTDILSAGTSSRMYQTLVKEKQLAVQCGGFAYEHRGPSLAMFIAFIRPDADTKEVEKLIQAEIDRIKSGGITDDELEKIRMQNKLGNVMRLQSTENRAIELGQFAVYYNDPNLINTQIEKTLS